MYDREDDDDGVFTGPLAIWVAFVKLCVEDVETLSPECRDHRTAATFLAGTRLMAPDGRIDTHGYHPRTRRIRTRRVTK